ncbi:CrcB family protein [Halalkalibacterium halodurans]|uniref:Fluoride-specific ion channel FluC 2 n=1 Tax=Halalkalibacterium halodurans (strain ATCC BAA-125 / DSM 18197 / FERM 7344 / JCM 9153 / C-125) TaxID=272558 RepID=FLUC2_HALH5|nr:CrcB family protein [Halalkalibacterium halodurans]Q9K8L9.1 RecName: Full=Fluoride-specific ion channel FluC 2 [Halalkalibacterium halodurans C-125]MED4082803.1 CrcB family protein [Halalkalibacterium halodurans]MED4085962.1 CrcB family protein [Halalkalibacterium halodurans]MED4103154.1 CrcB family protein [Halalkalibacterium halodurans]MED4109490.1 CrcB family protein [Halalkalibacterium halodurans]MED4123135.1 CrcB family protein [Halalkalibacterium halodurans]
MRQTVKEIVAIGIGGAIGTSFRFLLNTWTLTTGYPYGTLIENIVGSFLLGFLTSWFLVIVPKEWLKKGLGVGLCGGFTTMSTLAADSVLLYSHHPFSSLIYVAASLFGGIGFALLGYLLASKIATRRKREVAGS